MVVHVSLGSILALGWGAGSAGSAGRSCREENMNTMLFHHAVVGCFSTGGGRGGVVGAVCVSCDSKLSQQ